jgi:medium-chain acyl-[acyl-carrier-protein] hydrolase
MRLFCFPYAGGGASIYRNWQESFPTPIEVCPVQLPGREGRLREPLFTDITTLVEATAQALHPYFDKPFAFFGHSMGALISNELAHLLRKEEAVAPTHLFVSGHRAPRFKSREAITYNLPDDDFIEELHRLNGTPRQVLEHSDLMSIILPLLRADFEVCGTYSYSHKQPLECPITAFGGMSDNELPREKIAAWRDYTSGPFSMRMLPGDHFFIHTAQPDITLTIASDLIRHVR